MRFKFCVAVSFAAVGVLLGAASSDVADATMKGNKETVRALLQRKANVNAPQSDGTTACIGPFARMISKRRIS
jgi:hypothetical protein